MKCRPDACTLDNENDVIYIPAIWIKSVYKIKLARKSIEGTSICHINTLITRFKYGWNDDLTSMIIDDKLHTFGVSDDRHLIDDDEDDEYVDDDFDDYMMSKHTVYDIKSGELKTTEASLPNDSHKFAGHSMVHLKSKDKLLFFGGEFKDHFVTYDIKRNEWKLLQNVSLSEKDCAVNGAVITRNEKYVIIFCVYSSWKLGEGHTERRAIEIFDIENKSIRTSHAKIPTDIYGVHRWSVDVFEGITLDINYINWQIYEQSIQCINSEIYEIYEIYL